MHTTDHRRGEMLEQQRERMFAIAYGMLGMTAEAEGPVTVRIDLDRPGAASAGGDQAVRYQSRMDAFSGFSPTTPRSSWSRPRVVK